MATTALTGAKAIAATLVRAHARARVLHVGIMNEKGTGMMNVTGTIGGDRLPVAMMIAVTIPTGKYPYYTWIKGMIRNLDTDTRAYFFRTKMMFRFKIYDNTRITMFFLEFFVPVHLNRILNLDPNVEKSSTNKIQPDYISQASLYLT